MPFPQPREAAVSHEDTSLGHTPEPALLAPPPTGEARLRRKGRAKHSCPGPVRLGHITTLSSPFNQPCPRLPAGSVAIFSELMRVWARRTGSASRHRLAAHLSAGQALF